jgi:hypothetical protein
MTVGALVDAGAGGAALIDALESLGTGAAFRLEKVRRHGIAATKFHVDGGEQRAHRHLPQILRMIEQAPKLGDRAKRDATAVFRRLAEAEAKVHGLPEEKIHFHEVGAVDSIADIVGACFALDALGVERVACSAINTGSGTVTTEHGVLPVPAPATAELLKGKPVYARGPQCELTTPTGAAIAATLGSAFGPMPPMHIQATGFGAGTRDFEQQANVLRVILGEASGAAEAVMVSVLEANIDDASPQVLGYAMDRLFAAGALDVTIEALLMKKNRPGSLLRVIARPEDQETLALIMLEETTTIGLRIYQAERRCEARTVVEVETAYGKVRIKRTATGFSPEYDDCRKLALHAGVPLRKVIAAAGAAYSKEL